MNGFKVKCTSITQGLSHRVKRDADGKAVVENDRTVYESCPRWSLTFAVCGTSDRHGTFNLQTTDPAEAARYGIGGIYWLAFGPPPDVNAP